MQIVIDIPEEEYKLCKRQYDTECLDTLMIAVKYGTPLPEHYGRLIEKINSKKTYKGRASYSDMHDANMDKIYDIALDKAIEIIKEYREVNE